MHLSDFSSERLVNASFALFKQNLDVKPEMEIHVRYLSNAKTLLQHEVYPKLTFLAGMITEPLEVNKLKEVNLDTIQTDLSYYRFSGFESLLFIAFQTEDGFIFILGEVQFDDTLKVEWFCFDHDRHLVSVQNHHLKAFTIEGDFKTKKRLSSNIGTHIFSSYPGYAQSHKQQSKYVTPPLSTTVTLVKDNPFKEIMK